MFLKSVLLTSTILLSYLVFFGQSGFPYDKEWKLIDSLMNKKNLPKSALAEVNKVYAAAKKDKQEAQWVKAIIYRNHLQDIEDRTINQSVVELENEILSAPPRVAAILKSVEAEQLYQFLLGSRYQIEGRTNIEGDTSSDINTWTASRLKEKIRILYLSSMENSRLLLQTPLENFNPVLIKGNSRELRPTLYDLLAWRALDYFRVDNADQLSADNPLMDNQNLFSEAPFFMHYKFPDNDSVSNLTTAIKIYQQLLKNHAKDRHLDAWIDADINRIQFVYQYAQIPEKDSMYMNALGRITREYSSLAVTTRAWYLEAQWWAVQAASYDPLKDSSHRYDYKKAISICEQGMKNAELTEGKSNCEQLIRNIVQGSYQIRIEQVNVPNLPFRLLVTYKNINRLYGRLIRIDDATRESFARNRYDPKFWTKLMQLPYDKSFRQLIPETSDYQQHRVEIKINALPPGQYALLTSDDSSFGKKSLLALTDFFCSSISYVQKGLDYFVLDRDTGSPLSGVKIETAVGKYNQGEYVYQPGKSYRTDLNGYFHLDSEITYSEKKLKFYYGKDYLSAQEQVSYYNYYNANEDNAGRTGKLTDFIFTDRSIYRPGQVVYFKGILVSRDGKTKKYKAAEQTKTKIFFSDVNDQKIDSLVLTSNDFGSIQGSFRLPVNLLNGEFSLQDEKTGDEKSFSVEEYKRPTFYVAYDSVKGSWQVGDSIRIRGTALAYAGNTIDGAKMSWRVVRESRFPYPWLFRYYPSVTEQEIAHGESTTDALGKFNIRFKAWPDKSISRKNKPVFSYRVETTVTDANGESRSESTDVTASYQSFEIVSSLPLQSRMPEDSLYRIPVTTKNASGIFLKEKLIVSLHALQGPGRLIRKRYWEQPDQFVISESEYVQAFPYDEYRNETDIKSWDPVSDIFEKTDSTEESGFFYVDNKKLTSLTPGWYLLEFKAKDKDGEEIIDKRFIELTGGTDKSAVKAYNLIPQEEFSTEPGKTVNIQTGSDAKDVFVIRIKESLKDSNEKYSFFNLSQQIKTASIPISESDRGGFALNDVFVKNNRSYTIRHNIQVPWTNKELQISYQTWKDKTLPGSRELWKIKISGYKKDLITAEVLTSMYDASLDQFSMHGWTVPDIYPVYNGNISWNNGKNFGDVTSWPAPFHEYPQNPVYQINYDALISFGSRNRIMYKTMAVESRRITDSSKVSDMGMMEPPQVEMANFTPPKIVKDAMDNEPVKDEMDVSQKSDNTNQNKGDDNIHIRKNFNETAFFQPALKTDAQGNVEISFTMPDALTRWKWMVLANSKDLSFGYSEKQIVTQKELMVQTNMPRFFREGDTMLLPVKIANLSGQNMSGDVQLEWLDAASNQPVNQELNNLKASQAFNVNASQSAVIFFPVIMPVHYTKPILYRVIAKANLKGTEYSDGEENIIPVLSNRMLVTESLPLNLEGKPDKQFTFEKLLKSNTSTTLQNQSLTVEYTTNPAWYAVQSLPYLMEFPYECAEQTFNRFYANALASRIVQVSPAMQAVFEKWKNTDTAALLSNLQKNEELKTVLLNETPWVLQAQSETQQKKNLALLFDLIKMKQALKSALDKLRQMQSEGGGFPWFKGGRDDRYITQYIISGIGRLRKLKAIPADLQAPMDKMARSGIAFLDKEINSDYQKRDKSSAAQWLDPVQIQYLYMRSFFSDISVPGNIFNALNFYRKLSVEKWTKQSVFMQGMIALFLNRTGDIRTSKDILASLKENATTSAELGMYWKTVHNGYYWQEAPVETQSLLIETFQDLHADQKNIDQMKYWLLQQKRTNHWPTTKATADACYALLLSGSDWLNSAQTVTIQLGDHKIQSSQEKTEAGTGYFKKQIAGNEVKPEMGNIQVTVNDQPPTANVQRPTANGQRPTVSGQPSSVNPAWGAVYWQYFENLDKITSATTNLTMSKNLFIEKNSDKGPVLEAVTGVNMLKPGDKLKMRIIIKTDRDLEYVHLKDMRAACLEPVNVLSGYQWQGGLGYYETTRDASTSFFFDRLPKGEHVFEYAVFVTTAGNYSNGISSLECMYAPEFAAHSEGIRIQVVSK